jgi:cytochrome b6-f complex iron-sulfur subunit
MEHKIFYILSLIFFFTIALMYVKDGVKEGFNNINVQEIMNGNAFKVLADGKEIKLSRKCPHQGCNVDWNANKKNFICPCHQSIFDHQGKLLKGPAETDL